MKIYDDHYHCFGCGVHGDVTDFTARLFETSQNDAAKKLNSDFGLNLMKPEHSAIIRQKFNPAITYRNWLRNAEHILSEYLNLLCRWQTEYAPKNPEEPLQPNFVKSLTKREYCQYLLDQLTIETETEKQALFLSEQKTISALSERIRQQTAAKSVVKRKAI